ncbi:hypothetical protein Tco_1251852 [Tanacetum coccineum]
MGCFKIAKVELAFCEVGNDGMVMFLSWGERICDITLGGVGRLSPCGWHLFAPLVLKGLIDKHIPATKEKDDVQLTVQNFENSSKTLSKLLDRQIMDKCKTGLGYNAVPPPYTGNFMPPKSDLVYPSLDHFVDESVSESVVEKPTVETNEPKNARKENGAPIIKD